MSSTPLTELDYFTHYVAAYVQLQLGTGDDCIDWALAMIAAGRDTEHILVLAACSKPANHFEIDGYLTKALTEIGYPQKNKEQLLICHASYLVFQMAQGKGLQKNFNKIGTLAALLDETTHEFKMLSNAWDELEWGYEALEYRPGATLKNIESLIVQQAHLWLAENDTTLRIS